MKKIFLTFVVTLLSFTSTSSLRASTIMDDPFAFFNVYSLNDISYAGSDFQGSAGAGGDVDLVNFSVNWTDTPPYDYSLLAGGSVDLGSGTYFGTVSADGNATINHATIYGDVLSGGSVSSTSSGTVFGSVAASGSVTLPQNYTVLGSTTAQTAYQMVVDHGTLADYFQNYSDSIAAMANTGQITSTSGVLKLQAQSGVNVFSISAQELLNAYRFEITGPQDAVVYINVLGSDVSLNWTDWVYSGGISSEEVLLNFPEALTFGMTSSNRVNILAPQAVTTFTGGVFTGSLVVGDLSGSGQINLGHFMHGNGADPVPEPATMLLFGSGLCCLGGLRGRRKK